MSQRTAKFVPLSDKAGQIFTGGIVDNSEPWMIPYKNSPYARNFRVNGRGILSRPGFWQFGSDLGASGYPKGIAAYYRSVLADDRIVVRYDSDATHGLVSVDPSTGAQTALLTGFNFTSDSRTNFLSANDSLYCMNGVDPLSKLVGTLHSQVVTGLFNVTYRLSGTVVETSFNGTFSVTGVETVKGGTYYVEIDNSVGPNTFKWQYNWGSFTTGVAITAGTPQLLTNGVSVTFQNSTGNTLGASATITGSIRPLFGAWFDNSMFVAGDPNYPNRLFKSSENAPDSFSGTGADIFDSSYPIVGLASAAQTLYVFSENSIDMINNNSIKQIGSSLVYTSIPLEATEGAMNHQTIAVFGRDVYFLSKSGKIKKVSPNQMLHYDCIELSHRANRGITKTMSKLDPDQSGGFAYVLPEEQLIKWHLRSKGSAFNDVCVVYNTEYDEFMVDDHKAFFSGVNYKTKNFTVSQIEPKIYRDEDGWTDDGSPTPFVYDCKLMNFGEPTINKALWQWRTYLSMNVLAKPVHELYADGALIDSKALGASDIPVAVWGIGTRPVGTFAIGTEGASTDELYPVTLVRDKGYVRSRAKNYSLRVRSSELWARVLLQFAEAQVEMLPFLTTSHS